MSKNKLFNMEDFIEGKIAVQCETEADAVDFLKKVKETGGEWSSGKDLESRTNWHDYREKTCYMSSLINGNASLCYCDDSYVKSEEPRCKIIKWGDVLDIEDEMYSCTPDELREFVMCK